MADKIRKLSYAIRLGATFRPQCSGTYFRDGGSRALGAAGEAMGVPFKSHSSMVQEKLDRLGYPGGCDILMLVTSRNDRGESRESIADWLQAQGR